MPFTTSSSVDAARRMVVERTSAPGGGTACAGACEGGGDGSLPLPRFGTERGGACIGCKSLAARHVAHACRICIRVSPFALRRPHRDAIDRARLDAKLAAAAQRTEHVVHALRRADDRVDGTCVDAQRAADARALVDHCHTQRTGLPACGVEPRWIAIEHPRERCERGFATGRTAIDVRRAGRDRLCIRSAPRVTAARALRLRQEIVDPVG